MKFSKIAKVAKSQKTAIIWLTESGEQFLSVGPAVYMLEGMPMLDEETVLTVLGVDPKKKAQWLTKVDTEKSAFLRDDNETDQILEKDDIGMTILYGGNAMIPIRSEYGLIWVNAEYLEPLELVPDAYRIWAVRKIGNSRAIVVKDGLILKGIVMEMRPGPELDEKLEWIYKGNRQEEMRRNRHDISQEEQNL